MSERSDPMAAMSLSIVDLAQHLNHKFTVALTALRHAKDAMDGRDDEGAYRVIKFALKELGDPV